LILTSCPLQQPADVAAAAFLAALLQGMAREGGLYAPEVTPLCEALLHSSVPSEHRVDECAPLPHHITNSPVALLFICTTRCCVAVSSSALSRHG
jgi:hypothetical protein